MNPYQPPADARIEEEPRSFPEIIGDYYRFLGWVCVAAVILTTVTAGYTGYQHNDLSFLLWFWLGSSLAKGSRIAWRGAILVFILATAAFGTIALLPAGSVSPGGLPLDLREPVMLGVVSAVWLAFAIPALVLLSPRGRAAFPRPA